MLPLDAAFCSRCGVRVDAVPVIPLVGEDAAPPTPELPTERPRSARTLVGVVVGVLAVLVGLSVVGTGDDGDGDGEEAGAATSTTERTTTTRPQSRPTPSTTTPPASGAASVPQVVDSDVRLDPSYGMGLVAVIDDSVVVVDLATGKTTELTPPTEPRSIRQLVWLDGHLLVSDGQQLWRLVPGAGDPVWQAIDTGGRSVEWIDPSGVLHLAGDAWVVSARLDATGQIVDHAETTMPGPWGEASYPLDDGAALVSSSDGIFVVHADGTARRVATGRLVAASDGALLRYACDDAMQCGLHLGFVDGGSLTSDRPLGAPPTGADETWAGGIGPGGATAWVSTYERNGGGAPTLWIWSGDEWISGGPFQMVGDWMTWSDDGRALMGIGHLPSVEVVDIDRGPQSIRVDHRVRSGDMGWLLALVPLEVVSAVD